MATRALRGIDGLTPGDLRRVVGINLWCGWQKPAPGQNAPDSNDGETEQADDYPATRSHRRYSVAYTVGAAPSFVTAKTVNGSVLDPFMPGDPIGMPGSVMPAIAGRSDKSFWIVPTGT